MLNKKVIKELSEKGLLRKNTNNLDNYSILRDDEIEVGSKSFEVSLWLDNTICIQDICSPLDINASLEGCRLTGTGARIYRKEILEAIEQFKTKHIEILNLIKI